MKKLVMAVAAAAALVLFVPSLPAAAGGCSSSPSRAECDNVSLPRGGVVRAVANSHSTENGNWISVKITARDLRTGQQFVSQSPVCLCTIAEAKLRLTDGGTFEIEAIQNNHKAVATSTSIYITPTP